jgi:hypothetical protein
MIGGRKMASNIQILISLLLLAFVSGMYGWTIRDMKPRKRLKIKRRYRYRAVPYKFDSRA